MADKEKTLIQNDVPNNPFGNEQALADAQLELEPLRLIEASAQFENNCA